MFLSRLVQNGWSLAEATDSVYKWYGKAELFHRSKIVSGRSYEDHLKPRTGCSAHHKKSSSHLIP